ncbi:chemotaxis protein CheW (plasmid) [Sphaerotilus natans]|uniref:chemotaxis protein CheW n=1 Tax=Sphaerotilus natans TaxID=34103 RepID=UPI00406CD133
MNSTELLEQFIFEARECLERIGQRLLDVEKSPDDTELLNDLFRQVHTLKGNCGLFEFKAMERVVHAGEDLLDRVRNGQLAYGPAIADTLLESMDFTAELIDTIASQGQLPAHADERAGPIAQRLRQHMGMPAAPAAASAGSLAVQPRNADSSIPSPAPLPAWTARIPEAARQAGRLAVRYQPEPDCFFKGEDPWHHARLTPALRHLSVEARQPWPATDDFDCYACNLDLVILSDATQAEVAAHFRYVPEQIELLEMPAPAGAPVISGAPMVRSEADGSRDAAPSIDAVDEHEALMLRRLQQIWDDQCRLLGRAGVAAGTVAATRATLQNLLSCIDDEAARSAHAALALLPPGPAPLLQWARQHRPGCAAAGPADQPPLTASGGTSSEPAAGSPTAQILPRGAAGQGGQAGDEPGSPERGQKVLKVSQDKIDRLMELIGEMVVAKNALPYLATRAETVFQQRELAREIKAQYSVINRIAEDMQHAIMQVRMLPVGIIFQRFGRLVRDIGKKLGKDVSLVVEGEETEADKNVIESLADPLIHILRNSLDHGLETPDVRVASGKPPQGVLRVSARQEGDRVVLTISDDGAGIDTERVRAKAVERGLIPADRASSLSDVEAVQLVFLPGFSTAEAISDLSGRGVGMDVVRTAVERINGQVELESERGRGTTVRLTLPLSMAVTNVMMIEAGGRHFGVPMDLIVETVRVPAEDIHHFKRSQTTVLRGRIVPLRALSEMLGMDLPPQPNSDGELAVLVVRLGSESIGLLVDNFHGTSDIILKPLEGVLAGITGFAGTALMGDGSVLMILNPKELV